MTTLSRHATIEERAIAALPSPSMPFERFTRNGALRFLRIGRLQLSWCMCRKPAPAPTYRELMRLPLDQLLRIADFDQHLRAADLNNIEAHERWGNMVNLTEESHREYMAGLKHHLATVLAEG